MRQVSFYGAILTAMAFSMVSCSTSVIDENGPQPPISGNEKTRTISLRVTSNDFTRAGEESDIKNLVVALFKGDECVNIVSTKYDEQKETYDFSIDNLPGNNPDGLVAFANIDITKIPKVSFTELKGKSVSDIGAELTSTSGITYYLMSNSLYYEELSNNECQKIKIPSLNEEESTTLTVHLERVASKVTLNKDNNIIISIPEELKSPNGNKMTMKLELDNWDVTAVEKSSLLLKNLGNYNAIQEEIKSSDFLSKNKFITSWAHSLTWGRNEYPSTSSDFTGKTYPLTYLNLKDVDNLFGSSHLYHETTSTYSSTIKNSNPSVIIKGHYLLGDSQNAETFYKYGDYIYTETEYWDALANAQMELYSSAGVKVSGDKFKELVNQIVDNNGLIEINLKKDADFTGICFENGNPFSYADGYADGIRECCPKMEKFDGGLCYFVVPIQNAVHSNRVNTHECSTGCFGLVRNHHYTLNLKRISGVGNGVNSADEYAIEKSSSEIVIGNYTVEMTVTVEDWENVNQDIEI